jgi:hypothetical protein
MSADRYLHVEPSTHPGPCETHDWPTNDELPRRLVHALQRPGGVHACSWCVDRAIARCNELRARESHEPDSEPESESS